MNRFRIFIILGILLGTVSCSKEFLGADLQTTKKFEDGIKTATDLHNLVKGVYNRMNESDYYGRNFLMYGEVRSDNAWNDEGTGRFVDQSRFDMISNDADARDTWSLMYRCIQLCNVVINDVNAEGDADEIKYYKGQAYALRALVYFDLNRLYGQKYVGATSPLGVPIVTEFSNTASVAGPSRSTWAQVNTQIEADFNSALANMGSNDYSDGKYEITKDAVTALLGRHYLYTGQNVLAATTLKPLIISNNYKLIGHALYAGSWALDETQESIFEFAYTDVDYHGTTSYTYMWEKDGYKDVFGTVDLITSFDNTDVRMPFTGIYSGIKTVGLVKFPFSVKSHNIRIVHIGEVYMNYIEACVKSGTDLGDALTYANKLRNARHSVAPTAWTAADLTLANVLAERRLELATEGHRYWDLVRNGLGINHYDSNGNVSDFIAYPSNKFAFPIPEAEMDANPNLVNQNPGY